jgi:hypothetical protein
MTARRAPKFPGGIEPLIPLKTAAAICFMNYDAFKKRLSRHPDQFLPATYVMMGRRRNIRVRVLTPAEVKAVRMTRLRGPGARRFA